MLDPGIGEVLLQVAKVAGVIVGIALVVLIIAVVADSNQDAATEHGDKRPGDDPASRDDDARPKKFPTIDPAYIPNHPLNPNNRRR